MIAVTRLPPVLAAVVSVVLVAVGSVTAVAAADKSYPAVLAGHAVLPALTLLDPPPDAPVELRTSGKYATPPATGEFTWPFAGQPVQGH